MLHKFACHLCAEDMLIFSVLFKFYYMYVLLKQELSFHFLNHVFWSTNILNLKDVQFINFFLSLNYLSIFVEIIDHKCSVQLLSHIQLCLTPWNAAHRASLSITNSQGLLKLISIESVMPSSHLILCHPLLLPPSIFPSIRVFSNESVLCIRGPKYWSFSFSISPSSEYSGPISFRIDCLDLLAVQGTLKSLLKHHSSKALIL